VRALPLSMRYRRLYLPPLHLPAAFNDGTPLYTRQPAPVYADGSVTTTTYQRRLCSRLPLRHLAATCYGFALLFLNLHFYARITLPVSPAYTGSGDRRFTYKWRHDIRHSRPPPSSLLSTPGCLPEGANAPVLDGTSSAFGSVTAPLRGELLRTGMGCSAARDCHWRNRHFAAPTKALCAPHLPHTTTVHYAYLHHSTCWCYLWPAIYSGYFWVLLVPTAACVLTHAIHTFFVSLHPIFHPYYTTAPRAHSTRTRTRRTTFVLAENLRRCQHFMNHF